MYQVIKRDGKIAEFDISKISAAIKKAFEATNVEYNDDIIDFLALKVTADYASKVKDGKIQVEDIQDMIENDVEVPLLINQELKQIHYRYAVDRFLEVTGY